GDDKHALGIGHHAAGIGEVLAAQNLLRSLQARIDQRLALGVGTGGSAGEYGSGERGRASRKNGTSIELHVLLLGLMAGAGGAPWVATEGRMIARFGEENEAVQPLSASP